MEDLAALLKKCNRLKRNKKFHELAAAYRQGCNLFPKHKDTIGDPYFAKEYLQTLLNLNMLSSALRFFRKKNNPSLLILFIRYWYRAEDYALAQLACLNLLKSNPAHLECIDILNSIKVKSSLDQFDVNLNDLRLSYDLLPTPREKVNFYLGGCIARKSKRVVEMSSVNSFLKSPGLKSEVKNCIYDRMRLEHDAFSGNLVTKNYHRSLLNKLKELEIDIPQFPLVYGDLPANHPSIPFPFITKTRSSASGKFGTILKLMNESRHWSAFYMVSRLRLIPFEMRKDQIVWRGATTGFQRNKTSRFSFVEKYFELTKDFNVGFSSIVQGAKDYKKYMRGKLTIEQMCKFKYIVSISGNDKDSGLNWKLASGSVVIMPKPRNHSWLAEKFLIPGIHYIQMNDDFSDLPDLLEWCHNNQSACKRIAYNAKVYMTQFLDENAENLIQEEVIRLFFDRINFQD